VAEDLRVVHLAAYGGAHRGSFIPMLEAARAVAESRGSAFEAILDEGVERLRWYEELAATEMRIRLAPALGLRARARWLSELLAEGGPALLHTHFSAWDLPAALAARGENEASVVWHLHSRLQPGARASARNAVRFSLAARSVERILCVGPEVRDRAIARFASRERTVLFPNGIDLQRYPAQGAAARSAARARLGLEDAGSVLAFFGWDWETKGGPLFMDVLGELARRGREVTALVVGADQRVGASRATGVVALPSAEDACDFYAAADVFIAASVAEGFSFALVEALASGTPVVASDIRGHRYSGDGLPACSFAARTPAAFADAIEAELDSPSSERAARLAASRTRIAQTLTLERWSERLDALYDELERGHR
jgi:glycosyltransferase involved in cell wall biosynthesis